MSSARLTGLGIGSFLTEPSTCDVIQQLANAENIVFFVGAGVSQEAGLPSWHSLVSKLLQRTAMHTQSFRRMLEDGTDGTRIEAFAESYAQWLLSTHGPPAAAAMAKAWLNETYSAALDAALYGNAPSPLRPGPTAKQIARLWIQGFSNPEQLTVLTTNYDTLVEQALVEEGVDRQRVNSVTLSGDTGAGGYTVVHLHGILEPGSAVQELVLSEDDYYDSHVRRRWVDWATKHDDAQWVLMGTSLLDPNLLEFLYGRAQDMQEAGEEAPQFIAVTVAQGDQPAHVVDIGDEVLGAGRETADERLNRLALASVRADYFSQNAQVLYEVTELRRQRSGDDGDAFAPGAGDYRARIEAWAQGASKTGLLPPTVPRSDAHRRRVEDDFAALQHKMSRALLSACRSIRTRMMEVPSLRNPDEHLALHLWVHDPNDNRLIFVARSDHQFLNPFNLETAVIYIPTDRLVVEAICTGTVLAAADADLRSSRWNSMLAVPLTPERALDEEGHGRLPLGVLVLASSGGEATGVGRLEGTSEHDELLKVLAYLGERLLTHREERFDLKDSAAPAPTGIHGENAVPRLSGGSRILGPVPYSGALPGYGAAVIRGVEAALGGEDSQVS